MLLPLFKNGETRIFKCTREKWYVTDYYLLRNCLDFQFAPTYNNIHGVTKIVLPQNNSEYINLKKKYPTQKLFN